MLKVAPLIHSRTLRCDFNPGFLVRPNDFTDSDAKIIHKRILEATASIDSMQGFRWIVFHEGKFCVAGAVCILKNLASKCDIPTEDEKFFLIYVNVQLMLLLGDLYRVMMVQFLKFLISNYGIGMLQMFLIYGNGRLLKHRKRTIYRCLVMNPIL